jgi:tryptophan synthase alpha subunit
MEFNTQAAIVFFLLTWFVADSKLREYEKLITELCDALEWYVPFSLKPRDRELIQRAREATNGKR